jgi:peptide/nickel transport system substrate-binding protein
MNIHALITSICAIALTTLAGCGASNDPGDMSNGKTTFVYGRGGETDKLDPIHVDTGESVKPITNLFDTLVAYKDDSLDLVPSLAERWETSDDGLRWVFHLRKGAKFHDGTLLDAAAVKFSLERLMVEGHPDVHWDVMPYVENYRMIESIRLIDTHSLEFTLKEPSAVFLANLAMFPASIVSPAAVKKHGKQFAVQPVGTGPFRFKSWQRDQQMILEAFDDHWRGRPKIDRVIFVPVVEAAVRIEQLRRGEIQLADDIPPAELAVLEKEPGIVVQRGPGLNVGYLSLQNDKPPLNHAKVRQAIWHALDKQKLIEQIYDGRAIPAWGVVPPGMFAYHPELKDREFNPDLAKQLMEQAAAEHGFKLPVTLDLFIMASPRPYMPRPQETAVFIKQALAPIGIDVRIITNEITQHFQRLSRGEHQMGLAGWLADNPDPDNFLYNLLDLDNIHDLGGENNSRYRNEEVHKLLTAAQSELDQERRKSLYLQAQEIIFADAPLIPLVHTDLSVALRDEVTGYQLHPSAMVYLRNVGLKEAAQP